MRVPVTGGAGLVGGNVAVHLAQTVVDVDRWLVGHAEERHAVLR